jgi:hypothetical protein
MKFVTRRPSRATDLITDRGRNGVPKALNPANLKQDPPRGPLRLGTRGSGAQTPASDKRCLRKHLTNAGMTTRA